MTNTPEITAEAIELARMGMPTEQGLGALACKMNASGIQPPIDQEVITGLKDATANSTQRVPVSEIDALRAQSLSLVFKLIEKADVLGEYTQSVGIDSPQARFMRHMAEHHSAGPKAQEEIAKRVSSSQTSGMRTQINLSTNTIEPLPAQ